VGLALAVAVPLLWYRPETAAISRLLQQVDRHVTEDDAIILSCCLDEPLLYYERDHPSLFDVRNKEQIYLIESPHLGILDFQRVTGNRFACNRVDDWGEFSVYQCLPRE